MSLNGICIGRPLNAAGVLLAAFIAAGTGISYGAERRLVLADESRPRLHYWDSGNPSACFSIPGERPMWDLKRVGDLRYRVVCNRGFKVFDLRKRKVVDEFRHPLLHQLTAVCDMPDGGFVASVNPRTGPDKNKVVLLRRFSKDRALVATYRCEGFFYARSLQWDRDGRTLLLSWEKGFARIRIPESGDKCEVVGDFRQPKGRNLFDVVPITSGEGYLAGCGYGGGLVRFGKDGRAVSSWFVPERDGCRSLFYAQPKPMPDGHVYMAHWTGHGATDSSRGWQVVEFDKDGNVVWHLHDPDRFGSISGIDVLDSALPVETSTVADAGAKQVYVECESFDSLGGWVVDPHSMKGLGSSYVMAHGVGRPVADAETVVTIPSSGRYAVWARTRDWAAEWREGRGSAPGRFRVLVNGSMLGAELGAEGGEWHWQKAGELDLGSGKAKVALHDLTGFNGRCDALLFTSDICAKPPFSRPGSVAADNPKTYDLIVVGGGIAGICMAQTAARYSLSVLLLQDRDVLGGCNSSEVRVGLGGRWHLPPYPNLGNVLDEFAPAFNNNRPLPPEFYEDARKANFLHRSRRFCDVFFREHVFAVETDPADRRRIVAVLSRNTHTGAVTRHRATLFADATGDATVARLAGCETMYGREPRGRFNESCAPETASRQVMGHSTQWTSRIAPAAVPFPDIDWGFALGESNVYHITEGGWEQEAGQYRDMADDTEAIRDYGLYAVFSNWSYLKNRSPRRAEWAKREITWISPIGGKRESYRVVGDYVLTQNDIENHVEHPDLTAPVTWNIDLHFPDPDNEAKFREPFRSCAYHRHYNGPYAIPYRCLYARDCDNLFLAGRDISCSHVAFAATRVMGTLGVCGEVTGMAAAICRKHGCTPRAVYSRHLGELKSMMERGVPPPVFYHPGGCNGEKEYYHFKSDDTHERPSIHPVKKPLTENDVRRIRALGIVHRHEHPQLVSPP